ncbi:MAG: ABC transporter ATP-binding protein [Betaproteobacteria bacterium]|nr:ABC transporter ATP-binding protein [Betaproteobacteria bacterium]
MAEPTVHLEVRDLVVQYGGITAVRDVSFHVGVGETVALIGANGAGKTSILRAITGLVPKASGALFLEGRPITLVPPHRLPSLGLVMVPEGRGVFARMTVRENLQLGAMHRRISASRITEDIEEQYERFPRLAERAHQLAGTLSGGEQQMLALSRALMAKPQLLLLDEPSMGLAPIMVEKVFDVIADIASRGVSVLLVEQNARLALELAQRGLVLESGTLTHNDTASALLQSPAVRAAYLGEAT